MQIKNEELGIDVVLVELLQHHIEKFTEKMKPNEAIPMPLYRGATIRSAIESGWIHSPAWVVADVNNMKPKAVRWLAGELANIYASSMDVSSFL